MKLVELLPLKVYPFTFRKYGILIFSACVLVDMELVEVCSLWDIRLAILVKPEYKSFISRIQRASVRTGIANTLGKYDPYVLLELFMFICLFRFIVFPLSCPYWAR